MPSRSAPTRPAVTRSPRARIAARAGLAVAAALLVPAALAGPVLAAPAASNQGGVATFTDPDGAADALSVTLNQVAGPSVDPPGWNVAMFQVAPAVAPGAGCQPGIVGVVCAYGASQPAGVTVDLGGGDDTLTFETTESAVSAGTVIALRGGPGNDRISTVRARATIDGGDGNDIILPDEVRPFVGAPASTPGGVLSGGPGDDTVAYETSPEAVNVSLDGVANDGRPGEGDNVMPDIENIVGPGKGSILTGSDADNRITGGAGNDTIDGRGGDDELDAGAGNDTVYALDGGSDDQVRCGDGDDLVFADYGDTVDAASCETIVWAPALSSRTLRFKKGKIRIGLKCPTQATGCLGVVSLRTTGARPATIARTRYAVKRGKKTTLTLKATSAGRKALAKRKAINASALIALDGGPDPIGPAVKIRR